MTCPSCGAETSGLACTYCGSQLREPADPEQEQEALAELQLALKSAKDDEQRSVILRNAYIPRDPSALIDAAVQCLPSLDETMNADNPLPTAALQRLDALVTRLRLAEPTAEVRRALAEFEPRLGAQKRNFRSAARWTNGFGFGCLALIAAALALGLFRLCSH